MRNKEKSKTIRVRYKEKTEVPVLKRNMKRAKMKEMSEFIRFKTLND